MRITIYESESELVREITQKIKKNVKTKERSLQSQTGNPNFCHFAGFVGDKGEKSHDMVRKVAKILSKKLEKKCVGLASLAYNLGK